MIIITLRPSCTMVLITLITFPARYLYRVTKFIAGRLASGLNK